LGVDWRGISDVLLARLRKLNAIW